ncbi:hypothetical protein PGIGA_G00118120 [Pangasianodon gigas]|uniref:Uncharacterized protein n=1 Tax=Pangasianodon gigas TaxID=30993 RepID=A0ACC5XGJ5_PANGG|nr:hypothetical protein [Pangasianodon gigas]
MCDYKPGVFSVFVFNVVLQTVLLAHLRNGMHLNTAQVDTSGQGLVLQLGLYPSSPTCEGAVTCSVTDSACFPSAGMRALHISPARRENGGSLIALTALQIYYIPKFLVVM